MTKSRLRVLKDLTTADRNRVWKKAELARIHFRKAQRDCFIPDPFRLDSGGLQLDPDQATKASIEYVEMVFRAIVAEYRPKGYTHSRMDKLLNSACKFVFAELVALWKDLDIDCKMRLESVSLPKVKTALTDARDEVIAEQLREGSFLEKVPPEDPNYETAKHFRHQAWADSHALNAKAFAGKASFTDLIDGCVLTFQQGASVLLALKDETTPAVKCIEIDDLAERFIHHVRKTVAKQSKRLGKTKVKAINDDFFRRVNEIAAGTKGVIHAEALLAGSDVKPRTNITEEPARDAKDYSAGVQSANPTQNIPVTITLKPVGPGGLPRRSTRVITMGMGPSPAVMAIGVPKMTYEFPVSFPESARKKIFAVRLRAEDTLKEKSNGVRDFGVAEGLLDEFILTIFEAFVAEGHKLGMQDCLTAEQFESECLRFLHKYSVEAGLFDHDYSRRQETEIPQKFPSAIEGSEEWRRYRQLLQEVADSQATDEPAPLTAQQVVAVNGDKSQTRPLSARDAQIHDIVGERNFTTLTNAEIKRDPAIRKALRPIFQLMTADASKSSLDRIRNAKGYPLSKQIAKKRSGSK